MKQDSDSLVLTPNFEKTKDKCKQELRHETASCTLEAIECFYKRNKVGIYIIWI